MQNKMKCHLEKCEAFTVSNNETPVAVFINEIPFTTTFYKIGQDNIGYTDSHNSLLYLL